MTNIKHQLHALFQGKLFTRPLFYQNPGALRFSLSESGHALQQFITAHRKASEIAEYIFSPGSLSYLCLRFYGNRRLIVSRPLLRQLKQMELLPVTQTEYWQEPFDPTSDDEPDMGVWHHIAFRLQPEMLSSALWCALATDFPCIQPNPHALVYLINAEQRVALFPYDDRGMDVIGDNHSRLSELYHRFNHYLLEHDRSLMAQYHAK
ncbi:DUF3885 domain-containing protein [Dickeya fangzhongdai]|uniref:DUF3885 domain-containing protein n=1 Tax=Dickeya fangzhongdai TaxID=1778540 RepID=UPI002B31C7C9|nr:DUF3885 domain-containing protein [Dickeya fangzhongdai]